jgi:transposase
MEDILPKFGKRLRISGVGPLGAQVIIGEIGDDMQNFPSADHLTSWVGVAPGNNESAGKSKNVGIRKGNKYSYRRR